MTIKTDIEPNCPLSEDRHCECMKEKCAWYIEDVGKCAVVVIANKYQLFPEIPIRR